VRSLLSPHREVVYSADSFDKTCKKKGSEFSDIETSGEFEPYAPLRGQSDTTP
jgi:hypothetical protein